MADIDLPVFSFRPNRREAMSERLSFLTDVLRAAQGAEQRRSLRETPRRTFEADFLLVGPERTFWDLFMNRLGGSELMAPIYWEVVSLPSGLTAGVSDRIDFDTDYTEWPYFEGGLALVAGDSALRWEVVQIAAVDSGGIDLVDPVTDAWPAGAKLYPLRRAVVEEFGDLTQPSAAVGKVTARLRFVTANPWTPATEPAPIYGGLPVLLAEPNWADDLSASFERDIAVLDTNIGLTYQVDVLSRFFVGQAHRYFLPGREQMALFRDLLYRYRGRAGSFWLPTFKADFKLAASVSSGSNQLVVENVGFQYAGGPTGGREYIVIRHSSGAIFRKIVDVIPGTTSATEKLVLDSPVGLALSPGLVRKISFMDAARFDADEFEIAHHSGANGLHECSTAFRTFKNTRTAPEPISFPIPEGVELPYPCGEPITTIVIDLPLNPMPPVYDEYDVWFGNVRVNVVTTSYGTFSCQVNTTPRTNMAQDGYNEWAILGTPERVRYRYDPVTNQITVIAAGTITDLYYYPIGNRTLSPWPGTVESILPTVRVNGNEVDIRSIVTTSIPQLTDSATAYGTITAFPVLDIDIRFWTV